MFLFNFEQVPDESNYKEPAAKETIQTELDEVAEEGHLEKETWEDKEGAKFGSVGNFE